MPHIFHFRIYRRAALLLTLIFLCINPIYAAAEASAGETDSSAYSRFIDVPGVGPMPYYAQNDPLWAQMLCVPSGSKGYITFHYTGCGLAAMATVIASQLPVEELPTLIEKARNPEVGFPFSSDSVNGYRRASDAELFTPTTAEDFSTYLPVIFASYALSNNWERKNYRAESGATYLTLLQSLAEAYGLSYQGYRNWENAVEALAEGRSILTTVSKGIFTSGSHYLVLASIDDGWIYLLDPLMRTDYDLDRKHILEIVEPGLVRAPISALDALDLHGFYTVGPADSTQ